MRIATVVPSAAAPRYGATSGSGSGIGIAATNPSRRAWSRVERAIQSTAQDVRLRMNGDPVERPYEAGQRSPRTSRRWRTPPRQCRSTRARRGGRERSGSSQCLSTGRGRRPSRPVRRRGRRRANRGSCGSARRRAARRPTRSPRRGSRRPGCRRSRRPSRRTRARRRSGRTCSWPRRTGCRSRSRTAPWWWMRVRSPGAVDTIDEYSRDDPTVGRRDRDRALHPGVLADGRVPVGRGDPGRHRPMIRAGYHRPRGHLDPGPRPLPEVRAARRAVAAGTAATPVGGARRARRAVDQARGPAATGLRREQAAQPRVPRRRGAGRGCRHPRHGRPSLVEPRPADRRGRRAGRARGPPRPVRARRPSRPTRASASASCSARRSTWRRPTTGPSARRSSSG